VLSTHAMNSSDPPHRNCACSSFHPGALHGGAPVDAAFPERHTLVFRFFGDDATFRPLPDHSDACYGPGGVLFVEEMAALKAGDPFRSPTFRRLV
jgi:hypothetical protein